MCKETNLTPTKPKLKIIALFVFTVVTSYGCLTPKKMDKWINKQYEGVQLNKIKSSDYITVNTENITSSDKISSSQKGKSRLLPAIFYWQWEYSTISKLNPYIPISNFSSAIIQYANSKGLKQKLNGQKIELRVDKVPASFAITDKGSLVYLILFYVTSEHIFIRPDNENMVVSYRILKDNGDTKKGVITIADKNKPVSQKILQSAKKMTWNYLDQYDNNLRAMSKELVDKLIIEI